MYIYIIAQYLNLPGQEEDRFFKLGREWIKRGNQVMALTVNGTAGSGPGRKKIKLAQKGGLPVIEFEVPYNVQMSSRQKLWSYLRFSRLAAFQGRRLPPPDLVLAASPPLTAALPALRLSEHYRVPLIMEIRELWPDAPLQRGTLKNSLLVRAARRLEERVYAKADIVVAACRGIADAVREKRGRKGQAVNIELIPEGIAEEQLLASYDQVLKGLALYKDNLQ